MTNDGKKTDISPSGEPSLEVISLLRIATAIAVSPIDMVERELEVAFRAGVPTVEVEEVILQSYLFCGFPRTLNAMKAWRSISGVKAPSGDFVPSTSVEHWVSDGESTCRKVYAGAYEPLRRNISALHPALDTWMVMEGYGKVLSRSELSLDKREICIFAVCAAAEQLPQLRSHLRGSLNLGWNRAQLYTSLDAIADLISPSAMQLAKDEIAVLGEV